MNRTLKSLLRPLYSRLIHLPVVRRAIARAAASVSTEMNVLARFVEGGFGEEYGMTRRDRMELVEMFRRNCRCIESAMSADYHTVLAMELLSIPRYTAGDVIECGAFKGASTASLSLLCRIAGRRLVVCDSFEGLPGPGEEVHAAAQPNGWRDYRKGMFFGSLQEVQRNVTKHGDLDVCEFLPGFFAETLPSLTGSFVFAFLDVNLVDSMKDCLRWIWPLMAESGVIYTNDAVHMDIVHLCFDDDWWQEVLHEPAPGLIGSGCGLPLGPKGSSLGYIRKTRQCDERWGSEVSWLDGFVQVCHG